MPPKKQVPFLTLGTEGTQSFWPGRSTVRKGPPGVVVPRATIRACARDHTDGSSAEPTAPRASAPVQGLRQNRRVGSPALG